MYYKFFKIIENELIVHKEKVVNIVKQYREKKKISLAMLSHSIGLSERHLRFIESVERNPSLQTAKKIADCLNSTIEELFFSEDKDS